MSEMNAAVAVIRTMRLPKQPSENCRSLDFGSQKLSIVGKEYHTEEHVVGLL